MPTQQDREIEDGYEELMADIDASLHEVHIHGMAEAMLEIVDIVRENWTD